MTNFNEQFDAFMKDQKQIALAASQKGVTEERKRQAKIAREEKLLEALVEKRLRSKFLNCIKKAAKKENMTFCLGSPHGELTEILAIFINFLTFGIFKNLPWLFIRLSRISLYDKMNRNAIEKLQQEFNRPDLSISEHGCRPKNGMVVRIRDVDNSSY